MDSGQFLTVRIPDNSVILRLTAVQRRDPQPGAVCACLFSGVVGIRSDGEQHFIIAPLPGGTLTEAQASWKSIYGEIRKELTVDENRVVIGGGI